MSPPELWSATLLGLVEVVLVLRTRKMRANVPSWHLATGAFLLIMAAFICMGV